MSYVPPKSWEIPLVSKYLQLDDDERAFFKATTKLDDDAELERHILDVQAAAYKVRPRTSSSPCPDASPQYLHSASTRLARALGLVAVRSRPASSAVSLLRF